MRKLIVLFVLSLFVFPATAAMAGDGGEILGSWVNPDGDAAMKFYKCKDKYCAQLSWLKEPKNADGTDKLDKENPDKSKHSRKILGLVIAWGLEYDGGGKYVDGNVYAPDDGKTYSCKATVKGNKLEFRGYVGISLLGRSETWTKK